MSVQPLPALTVTNLQRKDAKHIIEKDGTMEQIVVVKNIRHHILADQTETKISWINGDFECRASGDISEQEAKEIINSIYKED